MSSSNVEFNFLDALTLIVEPVCVSDAAVIQRRYRGYLCGGAVSAAGSVLRLQFVQNFDRPASLRLGKEAVFGDDLYILDRRGYKLRFDPAAGLAGEPVQVESGFDQDKLCALLEALILLGLLRGGVLALHASCVASAGKATVFCAWGGTGKTRAALNLCADPGYDFIADEWILLRDGVVYPLRSEVTLFDYDLEQFPAAARLNGLDRLRVRFSRCLNNPLARSLCSRLGLVLGCRTIDVRKLCVHAVESAVLERVCLLVAGGERGSVRSLAAERLVQVLPASFRRELRVFWDACQLHSFVSMDGPFDERHFLDLYARGVKESLCAKDTLMLTVPRITARTDLLGPLKH